MATLAAAHRMAFISLNTPITGNVTYRPGVVSAQDIDGIRIRAPA
jgi:hypothetical protein